MARKRNPLRDDAYRIWIESNKEKLLKDIAEELGVSPSTIRKWKSEDKWDGETKRSAPNQKERYDSMKGNQNAKGNSGGGAPKNNQNAVSHGLFAKYLPDDTRELITELQTSLPEDIIWNNIMIQYSAIIRAQKIMYVRDEFDHTEDIVNVKVNPKLVDMETGEAVKTEVSRQFQYAWDKHASFMNSQSRAMSTLGNLIKQFVAIADEQDERRLKLELMQGQIKTINAKLADDDPTEFEDDGFLAALESEGEELWPEE